MMIASVLDYLKSDNELITMLNHKKSHPKITAYYPQDKSDYPYVIVTLTPSSMNIMTAVYNCEARIVTNDDILLEGLVRRVMNLLDFGNKAGFQLNNETLFHSSYIGGGFLFDEDNGIFEQVLNFNITFKRKRKG